MTVISNWQVTTPLYIINLDISSSWTIYNDPGKPFIYILTAMHDLTEVVISSLTDKSTFQSVATPFMEDFIFSFGNFSVVVIDANRKSFRVFKKSLWALDITVCTFTRVCQKVNSAKKYHHLKIKIQAIFGEDIGTHVSVLTNIKYCI